MLWLPVLLASHSSLAAGDSVAKATALSAPQRQLPADTTARDASTKPPRDSASPDATMTRWFEDLRSKAMVAPAGRALLEVCGVCAVSHTLGGALSCCCWLHSPADCAGDPSPPSPPPSPPSPPPSLPSPPSPAPATARSVALGVGYCRDASGINSWSSKTVCLDTVQECGQACEATADCACFAHTSPAANPDIYFRLVDVNRPRPLRALHGVVHCHTVVWAR